MNTKTLEELANNLEAELTRLEIARHLLISPELNGIFVDRAKDIVEFMVDQIEAKASKPVVLDYDQKNCPECDTNLTYDNNEVYCKGCGLSA